MKTIDKGTLMITIDENSCKSVLFKPVNGMVWLTKCELVELFDVYRQTINACIDAIFKANTFHAEEHCKCNLIAGTGKGGIKYDPYEFNLMFVIAMAFRIDSENSKLLREWVINRILRSESIFPIPTKGDISNHIWN